MCQTTTTTTTLSNNNNNNTSTTTTTSMIHAVATEEEVQEIRDFIQHDPQYRRDNDNNNNNEWMTLADLESITLLNVSGCGLTSLPLCMPRVLTNLSILFCSNNDFDCLPAVIGDCPKLQMVAFKSCNMSWIHPHALQPQLRWLILTDNNLTQLPDEIGQRCTKLQKCMLSGNQLSSLPASMANCKNLELIRLASNAFTEPPMHVLTQCPKLAWVALSDNPFVTSTSTSTTMDDNSISTTLLPVLEDVPDEKGDILGQGAGGITRKTQRESTGEYVAVKQYPTDVLITSDGLPQEERRINCAIAAAAANTNDIQDSSKYKAFIQVLGQTADRGALIMEYLENYTTLGKPPSFVTCSRDVYDHVVQSHTTKLSTTQATSIITDLVQACTVLHSQLGIMHGDLYGHNILWKLDNNDNNNDNNNKAKVRLSDFGAAFFYDRESDYGKALQTIEVRAFCILVQEIVQHYVDTTTTTTEDEEDAFWKELVQQCQSATTFAQIQTWMNEQQEKQQQFVV